MTRRQVTLATTPLRQGLPSASHPSALLRATGWVARLLGVVLLGASAYTHLHLAPLYNIGPPVTTGQLFIAQGVGSVLVALWLLLRDSTPAWVVATVVMAGSLAAVLVSVRLQLPAFGPFPSIYEPGWYPEKVVSAVAEGAFVALATVRLTVVMLTGDRGTGQRADSGT